MIGIAYVHSNNVIAFDAMAANAVDDSVIVTTDSNNGDLTSSSRKPSLLRSQLLRRTTTRTRKRSPTKADSTTAAMKNHNTESAPTSTDIPIETPTIESPIAMSGSCGKMDMVESNSNTDTTRKTADYTDDSSPKILPSVNDSDCNGTNDIPKYVASEDEIVSIPLQPLHHDEEFELKNGNKDDIGDTDCNLNISVIESDDEEEFKIEAEAGRDIEKEAPPQMNSKVATVATTNLSIVVTGTDIVVEYRDDRDNSGDSKESSPKTVRQPSSRGNASSAAANSMITSFLSPLGFGSTDTPSEPHPNEVLSPQEQSVRRRPKGIMKRPRDSNITYHHPRRPLPPPLPPPGYKDIASPMSWTSTDTSDSSFERQRQHPTAQQTANGSASKKRVSFDEDSLIEQYNWSKLRRKARAEDRRKLYGILSMAMPVIMPYFIAVLIFIASSMVPLPTAQRQLLESLPSESELMNHLDKNSRNSVSTMSSSPPIIFDVASRMWDERSKSEKVAGYISATDKQGQMVNAVQGLEAASGRIKKRESRSAISGSDFAAIAVVDSGNISNGMNGKSDGSKDLKVVYKGTPTSEIVVAQRFELRNPVARSVAKILEFLKSILFPFNR